MNLATILQRKRQEISQGQQQLPLESLRQRCADLPPTRDFVQALRQTPAIIAEVKKASPSRGVIRRDFDPVAIAQNYQRHGAHCLSVLTDRDFFQGDDCYLHQIRHVCSLPLLRKEFIIDPWQVYQSRWLGADAILLIVAALDDEQLHALHDLALSLDLAVLVESHDESELDRALQLSTPLIGINNRNLKTFITDINTALTLVKQVPASPQRLVISESGINQPQHIQQAMAVGIRGFLIGESLMRAQNPGLALRQLLE